MKVWINRYMRGESLSWALRAKQSLLLFNNTGRVGKMFERIWLSYKKLGRKHIISLNRDKTRRLAEKTVGIWVADSDYTVLTTTGEVWTGKARSKSTIAGRFGIYNVGTIIDHEGVIWELKEDKGWVIRGRFDGKA